MSQPTQAVSPLIRPFQPKDVPGVLSVIGTIYAEYGCIFDPQREDTFLLDPAPYFRDAGGEFWVAEACGNVVATAGCYLHTHDAELKKLYVNADFRRCGLGRRLTQQTIDHARAAGRPRMFLWSDTRFRAAHRLYRRMGFSEFGLRILGDLSDSTEFGFEMSLR